MKNRLFVEEDFADEDIKNRLLQIVTMNNQIDPSNLKISVSEGVATLEGAVDSLWKKILSSELAQSVAGVRQVNNQMKVSPAGNQSDEEIANNIKNNIDKNYLVDVDRVHIQVNNGSVRLSGVVRTPLAARAAVNSAIYTPGVTEVANRLRVSSD